MISGFCGANQHEGTDPKSHSGKSMKVCVAFEWCTCECHAKLNRMFEIGGIPREPQQNPNYKPARNVNLDWYHEGGAVLDAGPIGGRRSSAPVEQPSTVAPGLVESARTFTPNAAGGRQRGQLEAEVLSVCNLYVSGSISELMTTKEIAHLINPDSPPSQGAIAAVLERWEKIGFAKVGHKPIRLVGYTVPGMQYGLEYCKRAHLKNRNTYGIAN